MTRIKRGVTSHKRHKKLLAGNKGYRGTKSRLIKVGREASLHAGQYAYEGRKKRKRDFRRLWITRISQAVKEQGINYSEFVFKMKKASINIDRKMLAHYVTEEPEVFKEIVSKVKSA
ncbi:MAG: 50S ribosomal protein L20 [Patescibacteria group bacterium]|nr:50S ribosomal protein L20 [Patescibacteria group bacterium]